MDISLIRRLRDVSGKSDDERKRLLIEVLDAIDNSSDDLVNLLMGVVSDTTDAYELIFIFSYLLDKEKSSHWMEKLLSTCIGSSLTYMEKYFVYTQAVGLLFKYETYNSGTTNKLMDDLYEQIYAGYISDIGNLPKFIPANERNRDFILVLTGQILQILHGPTKTVLDRCKILQKDMGKDILLINLSVMQPLENIVPMYDISIGEHIDLYDALEYFDYEDVKIPFIQMKHQFPTIDTIKGLIELVKEYKPYQIVSVDDGIIVDVLSLMIDTMVISLTPSELRRTKAQFLQIGRPINDDDRIKLERRHMTDRNVISGVFTNRLTPQKAVKKRRDLGIPDGVKVAAVIGARLNYEVSRDFLYMVQPCVRDGLYLLFLGDVSSVESIIREILGDYSERVICPGVVSDPLMYLDHCYIYLNPIRRGGGISALEAMVKGVVPLSTIYGDVYINVGDEFIVDDYEEMRIMIYNLINDREFYLKMSQKARDRAEIMMDTTRAFVSIMNDFESRMLES